MSDAISWVLAVDVKDGKLEEYSSLMEEMVASTTEESGALAYEWFVSDDGGQVHIYERYADNAATMVHMGNFGAQFADRFFGCIEPIGMWVYGEVNDEVRETLAPAGAVFLGPFGGFGPR